MELLFITGTDTGVGKTTLTALLLCHLRRCGRRVVAMKPFCSGGREDAELLWSLQEGAIDLDVINPFHFKEPLAPLVAARMHGRSISMRQVLRCIARAGSLALRSEIARTRRPRSMGTNEAPVLLVEGAGGLLAPLGEGFDALKLIQRLAASKSELSQAIVVARNALGTINHTLLTVQALRSAGISNSAIVVVLMDTHPRDYSSASNPRVLCELLAPVQVVSMPFLGRELEVTNLPVLAKRHGRVLNAVLKNTEVQRPKAEIRNPKEGRNPKSEVRIQRTLPATPSVPGRAAS
jgi:dethiobiotin synthetase